MFASFLLAHSFWLPSQHFSGFAATIPVFQSNFGSTVLSLLSELAFQRQIFIYLTKHLIDFDIKYLIPTSRIVLLFWEIPFVHYFHFTLTFNPFILLIFTKTSFNKLLLMYLLQNLTI